ncbi:hypothetical protein F5Y17DRAFT_454849 [Xylariaceae sp. FL0594]|nr:hypothetical protein F5Y17DRAFT_454849 [Xylariaceae sp. FL0594]
MKVTLALLAAPLVALAAAAPKPDVSVPGEFVASALSPENCKGPKSSGNPINASGLKFYINRPTATYCPEGISGLDCSFYNGTQTVFAIGEGLSGMSLSVTVPGGQQVYVAPDGSLSYTIAHSAYIPPGSVVVDFKREQKAGDASAPIFLRVEGHQFYLCPVAGETADAQKKVSQVFAFTKPKKGCEKTKVVTNTPQTQAVWQYQ